MKKIRLIVFASLLHNNESVINSRKELFDELRNFASLDIVYPPFISDSKPDAHTATLCFIATGGTEESFKEHLDLIPKPVAILTDGLHNSLAAAFEICTYLADNHIANKLYNAPMEYDKSFFETLKNDLFNYYDDAVDTFANNSPVIKNDKISYKRGTLRYFSKSRVGLIGGESSWLISSRINRAAVSSQFGVTFIDIPVSEIRSYYDSISKKFNEATAEKKKEEDDNANKIKGWSDHKKSSLEYFLSAISDLTPDLSFSNKIGRGSKIDRFAEEIYKKVFTTYRLPQLLSSDRTDADMTEAVKMYIALKDICIHYSLTSLTIKCFDLIDQYGTTACLALSLLNDEGIICGCEGDIPALWSMMYVHSIAGQLSFMANPASANKSELTVDFAHCTIPMAMTESTELMSHFESNTGIGIAGILPLGRYTIVKCGGIELDKIFKANGEIVLNTHVPQRCRTQIRFKFEKQTDFDKFMNNRLGNHVVITPYNKALL